MHLQKAIDEFLLAMKADGLKSTTIEWYKSILRAYAGYSNWCLLTDVTPSDVRNYIVELRNQDQRYIDASQRPLQEGGLSKATINSHIRALHRFWKWSTVEFDLDSNPMENIRRPQRINARVKALADQDFVRLFDATVDTRTGTRDRAILAFLADSGCRAGGLLSLKLTDLDIEHRYAIVHEKGDRTRKIFFTNTTARLLKQWLQERPRLSNDVFCSMNTGEALTNSGLNQMLQRLKERAGVSGRVNPHSFRHAFARSYLQNGGDLVTLARLMGHQDITVTSDYYAIFEDSELKHAHNLHSPMNKFDINDLNT